MSWKRAVDPRADYPPLTPLGGPRVSGLARRPRWLCQSTAAVVAANVWRGINPNDRGRGEANAQQPSRTFLQGRKVDRTGVRQIVVWTTRSEREVKLFYEKAMKDYDEARDRWQANPSGPPPQPPSRTTCGRLVDKLTSSSNTPSAQISVMQLPAVPVRARGADADPTPPSPTAVARTGSIAFVADERHHGPPPPATCSLTTSRGVSAHAVPIAQPALSGSTVAPSSSSSCGSFAVPLVATSLRELREIQLLNAIPTTEQSLRDAAPGEHALPTSMHRGSNQPAMHCSRK